MTADPEAGVLDIRSELRRGEAARRASLAQYDVLDTPLEEAFTDLCAVAAAICGTPTAMVSLVDEGRQWFKARLGLEVRSTDGDVAFCAYALHQLEVLVVPDAMADLRFVDNPLVTGPPGIRFYAGAPLVTSDGFALGTLCVMDTVARELTVRQEQLLAMVAGQVMTQLEHRRQSHALAEEAAARQVAAAASTDTRRESARASEQRFRVLFDLAPIGMVESLPDGTLLAVNPTMCTLLGYAAYELVGQPIEILTNPSEHLAMPRVVAELTTPAGPRVSSVQRTYRRKDGTRLEVVVNVAYLRDETGQVQRVVATVVDVTERVAAENRLRESTSRLVERQAFTEALFDSVEVGIVACDAQGHLTMFNGAAQLWHGINADGGLDPAEFARHYDLFEADGRTTLPTDQIPLMAVLRTGSIVNAEIAIGPKYRPATRVLCNGQVLRDEHGTVNGAVVAMHDITALRAGERTLREQAALHDAILTASPDLIFLLDPVGNRLVWSSGNMLEMLGYTDTQVHQLGSAIHTTLVHPDDARRLQAANMSCRGMDDGQVLLIRYRAMAADGHYRWLSRRATPFRRDTHGEVTQLLAVARDVTDIVEVEERLAEAALHDPLTQLPNRRLLANRLTLALRRTARTGSDVAILFCDLDGFKNVNDTAGHAAGDAVLIATAERLQAILRPPDTVARVGGDEFVVLLELPRPVTGPNPTAGSPLLLHTARSDPRTAAAAVAVRIAQALREPVTVKGVQHIVTVSIGITFARAGDNPETALRDADHAMYQAKTRGKDRHEMFDTTGPADTAEHGPAEQAHHAATQHPPAATGHVHSVSGVGAVRS